MQDDRDAFDYFSRRSLQEAVAAINAQGRKASEAHRLLAAHHARRAASLVARSWRRDELFPV